MTLDTYIQVEKAFMKENIAELEEMIKQETNAEKKKKLEQDLVRDKYRLQELENPSAEAKKSLQRLVQGMNKLSEAMEGGPTKFEGEFNADKTELTIEKFPFYDGKTITVKKVVLKKQ